VGNWPRPHFGGWSPWGAGLTRAGVSRPCSPFIHCKFWIWKSSSTSNSMNLGGVEGQASVRKRPGLWSPLRAAGLRGWGEGVLGAVRACEVLFQQGATLGQVHDLGHLLLYQPWRAWPSRDPGCLIEPGLLDIWWPMGAPAHAPPSLCVPQEWWWPAALSGRCPHSSLAQI